MEKVGRHYRVRVRLCAFLLASLDERVKEVIGFGFGFGGYIEYDMT